MVAPAKRIHSIDALRGFDMFFLMQEDPALIMAIWTALGLPFKDALAKQLDHTPWIGFTAWDFIAPLFLFVVGLAIPLAFKRRLERGETNRTLFKHALYRTLTLIVLGLIFNGILQLHFSDYRYTGVLQRIALSYFFAAIITVFSGIRWQVIWTVILLVSYWLMMVLIPVPGFGAGVLTPQGPGRLHRPPLPSRKFLLFCLRRQRRLSQHNSLHRNRHARRLVRPSAHFHANRQKETPLPAGRRSRQHFARFRLGHFLPHHYPPVDQLLHTLL